VAFIEASPAASSLGAMQTFSEQLVAFRSAGVGSRHDALVRIVGWAFGMVALDLRSALGRIKDEWGDLTAGEGRADEVDEVAAWIVGQEQPKRDRRLSEEPPSADEQLPDLLELVDWNNTTLPEDELVEGLIIPGRWLQLVAQAKVGKSSLMMHLSIELSEGRHPLDGHSVRAIQVLYLDGEMGEADLRQLIEDCGHDPAKLPNLHCSTERVRLDTEAGAERMLRQAEKLGAELVMLDGLNGFVNAEASDNDDNTWKPLYLRAVDPLKRRRVAVVSGDNMGKDSGRGSRGSSVKNDKADCVMPVKRTQSGVKLVPSHRRGGSYADELDLEAEGFDRAKPIRYWRAMASWPTGTAEAVRALDDLHVPLDATRRKARSILQAKVTALEAQGLDADAYRVRNDALGAGLRYRQQHIFRPGTKPGTNQLAPPGTNPSGPASGTPTNQGGP
jgi:hypothetical protein